MNTRRDFLASFPDLQPDAVQAWLAARGWRDGGAEGPNARAWLKANGGPQGEVLLPTRPTAPDYAHFMSILVDEVARVEGLSREGILNDLSLAGYDVLSVRVIDTAEGTLDLDKAITVFREGRNALVAAANAVAAKAPRRNYAGRQPEDVGALMERVRIGPTSRGSYIVPILVPYSFDPGDTAPITGEWFARRVVRKLTTALSCIDRALARSGYEAMDALEAAVQDGVSANLCVALGRLAEETGDVELSIRWASAEAEPAVEPFRLATANAPTLKRAASRLVEADPPPPEPLIGFVTKLDDSSANEPWRAVIEALVDGRWRRVQVIAADDKWRSIFADAWEHRRSILLEGQLKADGRRLTLTEVERIEPLNIDEG